MIQGRSHKESKQQTFFWRGLFSFSFLFHFFSLLPFLLHSCGKLDSVACMHNFLFALLIKFLKFRKTFATDYYVLDFYRSFVNGLFSSWWLWTTCMQIIFFIVMSRLVACTYTLKRDCYYQPTTSEVFPTDDVSESFSVPISSWLKIKIFVLVSCFCACKTSFLGYYNSSKHTYKCRRFWTCQNFDFGWSCFLCKWN